MSAGEINAAMHSYWHTAKEQGHDYIRIPPDLFDAFEQTLVQNVRFGDFDHDGRVQCGYCGRMYGADVTENCNGCGAPRPAAGADKPRVLMYRDCRVMRASE